MPSSCANCSAQLIRAHADSITCTKCSSLFHRKCISDGYNLTTPDQTSTWVCDNCRNTVPLSNTNTSLSNIVASVSELKKNIENLNKLHAASSETMEKVLIELNTVSQLSSQVQINSTSISELNKAVVNLNRKQSRIDNLSHQKELVITGVPDTETNLVNIVRAISKHLGLNDTALNIDKCFKFNSKTSKVKPILLVLCSAIDRDALLTAFRRKKSGIKLSAIGLKGDSLISIGEHMSFEQRTLMNMAKEKLINTGKFKFLWFQNNNILAREKVGSKIVKIINKDNLIRLDQSTTNPMDAID